MCSQDLWLMREREREKKLSVIVILILKYSLKYIWINPSIWNKVLILYLKKREKKSVWAYLLKYLMFHKTWFRWLMIKFGRQVRKFVLKNFNFKRFASCVKSIWIYIYIYTSFWVVFEIKWKLQITLPLVLCKLHCRTRSKEISLKHFVICRVPRQLYPCTHRQTKHKISGA